MKKKRMQKKGIPFRLALLGGLACALCGSVALLFSQGCSGTLPAVPAVVPTPLPQNYISAFDRGSLQVNPSLIYINGLGGSFVPETYGGAAGHPNQINGSNNPNILVPLDSSNGNGSPYAIHVYGAQTDPLPTTYPAMEVFGFLRNDQSNLPNSEWYDLTFGGNPLTIAGVPVTTGIRFDVRILPYSTAGGVTVGDNNPQKRFAIACAPMTPSTTAPGGTCTPPFSSNCYNYFWAPSNLPTTNPAVNNGWQPVSFAFTSLKTDAGYGLYQSLNMNATYEPQAIFLLWKFGDNGAGTPTYTDFWFDNVQFY